MRKSKKVSIVIPCYNGGKYLNAIYQCLKGQTLKDFEVIFVDDGSTDDSGVIIDTFAKEDNRVKAIHQKNSGVSSARNAGLEQTTGEYVCFIDCDDIVENDYLEQLYSKTFDSEVDVVISMFKTNDNNGIIVEYRRYINDFIDRNTYLGDFFNYDANNFEKLYTRSVWGKLIKRELISSERFDVNYKYSEDSLFMIDMILKNPKIYHFDYCGYCYQTNCNSAVSKANQNKKDKEIYLFNHAKAWIEIYKKLIIYGVNINKIDNLMCFYSKWFVMILRTLVFYDKEYLKNNKKYIKDLANCCKSSYKGKRLWLVNLFIKHDKVFYFLMLGVKSIWAIIN